MSSRILNCLRDCVSLLEDEYPQDQWAKHYPCIIEARAILAEHQAKTICLSDILTAQKAKCQTALPAEL